MNFLDLFLLITEILIILGFYFLIGLGAYKFKKYAEFCALAERINKKLNEEDK